VCGLGWTFILSVYAGSAKSYSTPAAEEEQECSDPDEQMAVMAAKAVIEEQYTDPSEEGMAEAAAQAVIAESQQDESASTGSRVAERNLASYKA
jgi:phage baseplate assembly protein gpV